jgi:hypothetical protein
MTQATMYSSSASSIVVAAAGRIQFSDPHSILERLEKESIKEDWQLQYLDSSEWQALEVPMGLVSSIRRCLEERKRSISPPRSPNRSPLPVPRIHPNLFQSPPCENSFGHSQLKKRLRCKSPMEIPFEDIESLPFQLSPKSNTNQNSLLKSRPPSMPTRQLSVGVVSDAIAGLSVAL